ncbi:MAG: alpha/beta hydrolase-fold protein, partial [Calditrichota bacterium]
MFFFRKRNKQLTIRVRSETLPEGETIFVVGNHELLGDWQPNCIPLLQQEDGSWLREFQVARNTSIEFKITRGAWEKEAVDTSGNNLMNHALKVTSDVTVDLDIVGWRDLIPEIAEDEDEDPNDKGELRYHRDIGSDEIAKRDVVVWLPPEYDNDEEMYYPVLYMHDGQNVFDPSTSYSGIAWQADRTALSLIEKDRIQVPIIVAVNNCASAERLQEYSFGSKGRHYLEFMAKTVKPLVDKTYRTLPEAEHTAIMGASMGGLCAFLQLWLYPDVFGKAACLSPTFIL